MLHGNHKVLDARAPRLDHRLDHRSLGRVSIRVHHHAEVVGLEHRLEHERQLIERGRRLVDENLAVVRDGQRYRLLMLHRFGVTLGQVDRDRVETLHRQRREHERHQQEEHHVDHRDDLDAPVTKVASPLNLHRISLISALIARLPPVVELAPLRRLPGRAEYDRPAANPAAPSCRAPAIASARTG